MDERRMGYPPAADPLHVQSEIRNDWPLGVPQRVADEYELQHRETAARKAQRDGLVIDTDRMTAADAMGCAVRRLQELRLHGPSCPGCGVARGAKHFLSCWQVRPALLAEGPQP